MKKIVIAALMLALCMAVAVPALAEGVRDANAAYNELLAGFNGKYPDEYAGAYVDTSDGDKLCVRSAMRTPPQSLARRRTKCLRT